MLSIMHMYDGGTVIMRKKQQIVTDEETEQTPVVSQPRKFRLIKKHKEPIRSKADVLLLQRHTAAPASTVESINYPESSLSAGLHDQIEIRAYELYQLRGGHHGQDWEDWFEAQRQIISKDHE